MTSTTEPQGPSDPGWVSRVCVAWALDDAPCPTELLPVLIAIARRCNNDGTGSYQSKPTLAEKTGKSRDQVDADVKKLLTLGLIRRGDQTILENSKIPDGQRPVVYDVALEKRGPKPTKAGRNREGKNKDGKVKSTGTHGTDTTPGMGTGGGIGTPGTPGMDTPLTPGMGTPQINPSKNPLNNPSSLSARTSVPAAREPSEDRERDEVTSSEDQNLTWHQRLVIEAKCPPHLAAAVSDLLRNRYPDRGPEWWRKVHRVGDLAELVKETIPTVTEPASNNPDLSWLCGTCGDTGWITTETGSTQCGDCTNDGTRRAYASLDRQGRPGWHGNLPVAASSEGRNAEGWNALGNQIRANMAAEQEPDRTPRGGSLGRKFAGRIANYDERL